MEFLQAVSLTVLAAAPFFGGAADSFQVRHTTPVVVLTSDTSKVYTHWTGKIETDPARGSVAALKSGEEKRCLGFVRKDGTGQISCNTGFSKSLIVPPDLLTQGHGRYIAVGSTNGDYFAVGWGKHADGAALQQQLEQYSQ